MRTVLPILLAAASFARADFSYQSTATITGGALFNMLRALGPFTRGAREPIVTTHLLKGNRMASISKDNITIIDLDKSTITQIDVPKKTYSVMTFEQMKQAMDEAVSRAQQEKEKNKKSTDAKNVEVNFKVSAKATGESKTIGVLNAKETILTMTMEGTDKDSGNTGSMDVTVDSWLATVPGYEEVKEFHRKLAEKIGWAYGSGMSQMAMMTQPGSLKGFAEAAKELNKVQGVPIQSKTTMGGTAADPNNPNSTASSQQQQSSQQNSQGNSGIAGGAIGRLGGIGGFGRKKNNDQPKQDQASTQQQNGSSSGVLIEMTTDLSNFSAGPADASKFEVPAGFKQVESDLMRRRAR